MSEETQLSPTEFVAVLNQTLYMTYPEVTVVGEVASFKVNQGKWVFFDIKDEESSVPCFMTLWSLSMPLEDGMKVMVQATPKLTKWGKFSLTVTKAKPVGEGSLKKAYEMLKAKLTKEGLFDAGRKRGIPDDLTRLGVISSTQAAGYADFIKIINARWGGLRVTVAHTQVQGMDASEQMIRAIRYLNERTDVQMIAILRGGGSADDLSVFNDERLVREIAASRVPVITGVGHEVDETLADLAADVRASTPSNAAEMLTHDRIEELSRVMRMMNRTNQILLQNTERERDRVNNRMREVGQILSQGIERKYDTIEDKKRQMLHKIQGECTNMLNLVSQKLKIVEALNPEKVLKQGYAIMSGTADVGNVVKITTFKQEIEAEVKKVAKR